MMLKLSAMILMSAVSTAGAQLDLTSLDRDGNRAGYRQRVPGTGHAAEPGLEGAGLANWVSFGPSGADAEAVAVSPTVAGVVITGVSSSVGGGSIYRSVNSGATWTLASGTGNRTLRDVVFTSAGVGWAATDNGLFRSTDAGATWSQVALPIVGQALVEDIALDAISPPTVWIGLGQFLNGTSPVVVLKSEDGGSTWSDVSPPVGLGLGATVVKVDPANPQRAVAAFTPNFGGAGELWLTTDGGANWAERTGDLPNVPINDFAFAPGVIYVAGGQDFGAQFLGLWSTVDDGLDWTNLSADWPSRAANAVAVDPNNPLHILVGTTRAGVARSVDGGLTFVHSAGGTGSYQVNDIHFAPGSTGGPIFLGMGSVAVFKSPDGAANFVPSSSGISRLEITSFSVNPLNTSEVAASYIGVNDGGIFTTTDAGGSWTLSQAPLPRWLAVHFGPDGTLYATHNGPLGRADDGLWKRNANGTWTNLGPGSPGTLDNIGVEIAVSAGPNPKVLWGGYRWLPFPRLAQIHSYNLAGPGQWRLEYLGDTENEQVYNLLWLGGGAGPAALASMVNFGSGAGGILRSTDSGDSWARSELGYPSGWNAWDIDARGDDAVYVAATPNSSQTAGGVYKSTDAGVSWSLQGGIPAWRYLAADPSTAGVLYALSPFNNARPQRSTDDGAAFVPFDTNFFPLAGGRDVVHGGVVGGVPRLYVATGAGGFATSLPVTVPGCAADFNGDGEINPDDLGDFINCYFSEVVVEDSCEAADFNRDDDVNPDDLGDFINEYFEGCQ